VKSLNVTAVRSRGFQRKETMQKTYELMVLLHPDLEIDVEVPVTKVEGLIEAAGGHVIKRDNWGKKRLAYRIARQDFAIYVYFEIQLDTDKVAQLENTILITEEVLRHILVVHEVVDTRKDAKKAADKAAEKAADKAADKKVESEKSEKATVQEEAK
jgi:small subunit ribosomal protein S6